MCGPGLYVLRTVFVLAFCLLNCDDYLDGKLQFCLVHLTVAVIFNGWDWNMAPKW